MTDFSLQNSQNRANGQYFEDLISQALEYYYEKGYASIEKTPEPMRVLKNCGENTFLAVYTKKAQPDYKRCTAWRRMHYFRSKIYGL